MGHRLEKNEVRAVIELLTDAQQRHVLRLMRGDGLAQSEVLQVSNTRTLRFHRAGVDTMQKVLVLVYPQGT